ncbi:MAG: hypothetical protein JW828_06620 [Sedimentisphaerales bacterium]|nr:hypothetical protein [Sedimentisphaerales bacterium]
MKRKIGVLVVLGMLIGIGMAWSYPRPAAVPAIGDWTLEVVYENPQQITMRLPGEEQPRRFWYILLTVTNTSAMADAPFYPSCEMVTDTFKTIQAGTNTPRAVFDAIKLRHQGVYPFLEALEDVDHKILQGQDHKRDIAIIWPDFDAKAGTVTFFVAGLSNETTVIDHPIETDAAGRPQKVILRKTLGLEYFTGGDAQLRAQTNLTFKSKIWVMR